MNTELDFDLIDDILPIPRDEAMTEVRAAIPVTLGPLVEYAYLEHANAGHIPPLNELTDCLQVRKLRKVFSRESFSRMSLSAAHHAQDVEFHWLPPDPNDFRDARWVMFQRRLQNAAERAGFSRLIAAALTGSFGEMADNAYRHSRSPLTAIGGYRWSERCFEYVVADAGVGVLASLRTCPEHEGLQDAGDALQTALTEGESCMGRGTGHGLGFRSVFLSLAGLNGFLRFRSGDHSLSIDSTSPELSQARIAQLGSCFQGFLVSVRCKP